MRQPSAVRSARVAGRVRSWPASLCAAAMTLRSRTIVRSDSANASARRVLPAATATLQPARERHHRDEVHVDADGDRGVAPGQAARGDDEVVDGADAQPAEVGRNRRHEVAGVAQRADAVVRIGAVAVMGGGAAAEVLGESFGEGDQVRAGRRVGAQLHRRPQLTSALTVDRHAVGDHVVDDRPRLRALDDLAQLLGARVALDREGDVDALEPVAVGVVDPGAPRASRTPVSDELTSWSSTLRAAATLTIVSVRQPASACRRNSAGFGASLWPKSTGGSLASTTNGSVARDVLGAGAPEAVDRRPAVGAVDPAVAHAELEAGGLGLGLAGRRACRTPARCRCRCGWEWRR